MNSPRPASRAPFAFASLLFLACAFLPWSPAGAASGGGAPGAPAAPAGREASAPSAPRTRLTPRVGGPASPGSALLPAGLAKAGAMLAPQSTTWTVVTTSDDRNDIGSLRYCVEQSNPGDTINFNLPGTPQTIQLTTGSLNIKHALTINGPGSNLLTISGGMVNINYPGIGTFLTPVRVFFIEADDVSVGGLTIANGVAKGGAGGCGGAGGGGGPGLGGGIFVYEPAGADYDVTLKDIVFRNNQAIGGKGGDGGGCGMGEDDGGGGGGGGGFGFITGAVAGFNPNSSDGNGGTGAGGALNKDGGFLDQGHMPGYGGNRGDRGNDDWVGAGSGAGGGNATGIGAGGGGGGRGGSGINGIMTPGAGGQGAQFGGGGGGGGTNHFRGYTGGTGGNGGYGAGGGGGGGAGDGDDSDGGSGGASFDYDHQERNVYGQLVNRDGGGGNGGSGGDHYVYSAASGGGGGGGVGYGGAVFIWQAEVTLIDCSFSDNVATGGAGGTGVSNGGGGRAAGAALYAEHGGYTLCKTTFGAGQDATGRNSAATTTPAPSNLAITAPDVCTYSTNTASVSFSQLGQADYQVLGWTISDGQIVSTGGTNNSTVTFTSGGFIGTQSLNVTIGRPGAFGCRWTYTKDFLVIPSNPVLTVSGPARVCANSTGNQATGQAGMNSYAWTITGGTITAGANARVVTFTAGPSGAVRLILTATGATSTACSGSTSTLTAVVDAAILTSTETATSTAFSGGSGQGYVGYPISTTFTANSQAVITQGGSLPPGVTFAPVTVNLPFGATATGGLLSGTPTMPGTYQFTVTTTNECGSTTVPYTLVIGCDSITVTGPSAMPPATQGVAYSASFGPSGYTFSTTGALPPGLSMSAAGVLSGTPTDDGTYAFTVVATNATTGCTGTRAATVVVGCQNTLITPAVLAPATTDVAFQPVTFARPGATGVSFSITSSGGLPSGMTLSPQGVLSGTPVETGAFPVTITANDANGCPASRDYMLAVACPPVSFPQFSYAIDQATIPSGTVNASYTVQLTTSGGGSVAGRTIMTLTGDLPPGLGFAGTNGSGRIQGVPTRTGVFQFTVATVNVLDGYCAASRNYVLAIKCAGSTMTTGPATLPQGTNRSAYTATTLFDATGGTAPYTYELYGSLPPGLSVTNGVLSGTPETTGSFAFSVSAVDANGCPAVTNYTLVVVNPAPCGTITIGPASLAMGRINAAYPAVSFTQSGGTAPVTYQLTGALPAGMSFANGVLSGTPTANGNFPITVKTTDWYGCTGSKSYTLVIQCANPFTVSLMLQSQVAPGVTVAPGVVGGTTFVGFHAAGAYTVTSSQQPGWFTITGTLPAGIVRQFGGLYGAPQETGTFPLHVEFADPTAACGGSLDFDMVVTCQGGVVTFSPSSLPEGTANTPYPATTITPSGGTISAFSPALTVTGLPPGMTYTTGVNYAPTATLSGTPTAGGTYQVGVTSVDYAGCASSITYALVVRPCPTIAVSPSAVPAGVAGAPYTATTFTASGGIGATSLSLAGTLPSGMTFANGTLSGTPGQAGTFPLTVTATDANGCTGSRTVSLVVGCPTATPTATATASTLCGGASTTIALANAVGGIQWQSSSSSAGPFSNLANQTGATLATGSLSSTTSYRALVTTPGCTAVTSTVATVTVNTAPAVTTNPGAQTKIIGQSVSFTAAASGAPAPTVQWQVNGGNGFADIQGATSATLTGTAGTAPFLDASLVRAVFTNSCSSATTTTALLTVTCVSPSVTTNPSQRTVCAGSTATFTAAASGTPAPTVQWQESTDGTTFTDIPGATGTTLSFTTSANQNGNRYRARFTNTCAANVATTAALLIVNTVPTVTTNPSSQSPVFNQSVSFTAAASGAPLPTVQWQVNSGGGFVNIQGATSATLTGTAGTAPFLNGAQFRAVFTNPCSTATTTAATLTVVCVAPSVTANPSVQVLCAGATATFTAAASGTPAPAVQWQESADGGVNFFDIPGATGTTLSFTAGAGQNGRLYRARFTNPCAADVATAAASLTVNTSPVVASSPAARTACSGDAVAFTASASGSPAPAIQWEASADGGQSFIPIAGADGPTLSGTAGSAPFLDGARFRAVFANACGGAASDSAALTVHTASAITTQPASQTVASGASATLAVAAGGTAPLAYQWYVGASGDTGLPVAGATSASFVTPRLSGASAFWVRVSNGCGSADSEAATVGVTSPAACAAPPTALQAWWQAEGGADDAMDANGGTAAGGTSYVPGLVGQAFRFDGTGGSVSAPDSPGLNPAQGLTLDAWVRLDRAPTDGWALLSKEGAGAGGYGLAVLPDGSARFSVTTTGGSASVTSPAGAVQAGLYAHVAGTYDATTGVLAVYVNGQPTTGTAGGALVPSANSLVLGADLANGRFLAGTLDEADVFGRALSPAEVQAIFAAGGLGKCPTVPSTASLAVSAPSTLNGQAVTLSATVASPWATPTGSVEFLDGGTSLGSGPLAAGAASLTVSTLAPGTHAALTARYLPTAIFAPGTSSPAAVSVGTVKFTTTGLSSSPNPSAPGQAVVLTVTVAAPAGGTPGGSVRFYDGAAQIGSKMLSGGAASLTVTTLAAGTHSLTAVYQGATGYATSTSAVVAQTVNLIATTTVLASTPNPSSSGKQVTFTAAVTAASGGSPTGSVNFYDGSTLLGTGTLSGGSATLKVKVNGVGAHPITAVYQGSATHQASTSGVLTQQVR